MKPVGERIRQARQFRGMSGQELAEKVGYKTQSGIANLENRSNGSGGHALPKIAEALNVSLEWLLAGPDTHNMYDVAPFKSNPVARQNAQEPWPAYDATRSRAHSLVDSISDKGLAAALEVLQSMADRHPRHTSDGAGFSVPANERKSA